MKKLLSVLLTLVMLVPAFGSFPVIASAESAVAQVVDSSGNATDYTSFEAAWEAAVNSEATFKLLTNWRLRSSDEDFGKGANVFDKAVYFNGGALSVPSGKSVTIDLNGWEINRNKSYSTMTDNGSVIRLFDGASLTINDSSADMTGVIMGGRSTYGGGIYAPSNNIVTLNGGRICLNNGYYGGGVYLDSSSKLTLNGGSIDNNLSYYGGGVYAEDDALFETHGGVISLNRATADGGGIYLWSAKAVLDNCTVSNNSAKNGGAIFSDYNVFKSYSQLELIGSKILNNTADNYYGGIYHCAGYISLEGNTRIMGNKNNGYYGGGVYSQKAAIHLSGNVQVYGNYFKGDEPCDVNFGKSLEEAFILKGNMWGNPMIGVYTTSGTTPTYWCRDYHLYGNCTYTDENVKSLAKCLFSNSGTGGFVYKDEIRSHLQDRTWHYTMIKSEGNAPKYDVKVTQVSYKDVILSPSEYSFNYNYKSRTVNLNLPNYVNDLTRLKVKALLTSNQIEFDLGAGVDISNGQALVVNTSNPSTKYTLKVDGGTIDGTDKTEISKLYLEPFSIAPTVPAGEVFSNWEVDGDVPGFEKYAKSPADLEMPKDNVTLKAVFKDKVSEVDITLEEPNAGDTLASHQTAAVKYKAADGTEKYNETVDVIWRKNSYDGKNEKFDYNSSYNASFNLGDSPGGDFGLADASDIKINLNGAELSKDAYKYLNWFENGSGVYGNAKASDSVKQRTIYVNYTHTTEKANVLTVDSPTIEISPSTSTEELKTLLPDSVNIIYESIDGDKTASAPVLWGELPSSISGNFTISGTVSIPDALDAAAEQKRTSITVKVTSDKQRCAKPSASVNGSEISDGETIAIDTKITLSAEDGATIWYKIDDGAFMQYNADTGIVPQGEAGKIVDRKITAYCEKTGCLRSEFLTLNIKVDNESVHTVKIVDKNGAIYGYASGAGEYNIGDTVTVKARDNDPEKFVSSWSADGIELSEADKTASEFTFAMQDHDVTITAEAFRYYAKKLYLSSITPISDNTLPQTLDIIYAEDINGNVIDKKDVLAEAKLEGWQIVGEGDKSTQITDSANHKTIKGNKYRAFVSVNEKGSAGKTVCDNYEMFFGDVKLVPEGLIVPLYYIDFTAVNDELISVDLGDSITVYTGNEIDYPETIGVKTKYGSVTTAKVTWEGSINTETPGDYPVTAKLTLPENVTATEEQKNINVTVKVCSLVNSVVLETVGGSVPTKAGKALPTGLSVTSGKASLVDKSFSISPSDGNAVSGTEYTITAKVKPAENCEFAANAAFTIDGATMNASPVGNGEYTLTYTFTAEEKQSFDVSVNDTKIGNYEEGATVSISTDSSGFYKWTAEAVYETTETVIDEADSTKTKEVDITHRNPISVFADRDEYKAATSFVMPKLADGSRLEITANTAHGIIDYDNQTRTADIVADKAHKGITVIFAAYYGGTLTSVGYVDKDLTEGFNAVTAPEAFSITGADTIKVMVWTDFENIIPLFEDFEKQITGDEIK